MKKKKKSFFGLGTVKFFVILVVVFASAYFIWNFMSKNSKSTKAAGVGGCCSRTADCPSGFKCVKHNFAYTSCPGTCQLKNAGGGAVNFKCNCASDFGPCGNKWGQTNIKSRECKIDVFNGTETCNLVVGGKLYQWVSCN